MRTKSLCGKDWYLGLDIGTASVGWAVTDEQYNIPRLRGQRAWGVRLFEEANTAESRRLHRGARRRHFRRKQRLKLLGQIFEPYVDDPNFFNRLADSFFHKDDELKREGQKHSFFNDADYTDGDYFRDFPTIFHLRKYLMNPSAGLPAGSGCQPKKLDARHYYLAIHNIIKFRGHFLFPDEEPIAVGNASERFGEIYNELQDSLEEVCGFRFGKIPSQDEGEELDFGIVLLDLLKTSDNLRDKKTYLKKLKIEHDEDAEDSTAIKKSALLFAEFLIGWKLDFSKIVEIEAKVEMQLRQAKTDERILEIAAPDKLGADWLPILEKAKQLSDIGVVMGIIGEHDSLSDAYISLYAENEDRLLKYLEEYSTLPSKETKEQREKRKAAVPKLRGHFAGAIPMQMHLSELKAILQSFANDYPEFKDAITKFKDDPTRVKDSFKIRKLLTHRVPYYVGPLTKSEHEGKTASSERQRPWVVRYEEYEGAKIYPWNFDVVVDRATSADRFIKRMIGDCTYLIGEKCLPKESILYQEYMILNEINKIKLDGHNTDPQTKQKLFDDLFMTTPSITLSSLKRYFASIGKSAKVSIADSEGTGGRVNHKMTSYLKFRDILGAARINPLISEVEEAILAITVLPDDREMLKERLQVIFANSTVSDEQIEKISRLSFSGWGSFSRKLLDSDGVAITQGAATKTIIQSMRETNANFMELMREDVGYKLLIDNHNKCSGHINEYDMIDNSYASVPVKRAVRQAVKIVRELEQVIGKPPAKVFIETPRSNQDSGRTEDRKAQLTKLYSKIKQDVAEYKEAKKELEGCDNTDLKPRKVYLYFTQGGRCAYCGEKLNIGELPNTCEIDHIIPQALVKDDSFDNLVLVHSHENRAKGDTYPLNRVSSFKTEELHGMWNSWYKNGLISAKKLKALSRTELSFDEIAGFINRQLVETSQTTKMVMEILRKVMPDTRVVFQKAETVSEFRHEWARYEGKSVNGRFEPSKDEQGNKIIKKLIKPRFMKLRELNDLHHAKDAYLTIVVGNVYDTKFTSNPYRWVREQMADNPYNERRPWNMRSVMYDDRGGKVSQIPDGNGVVVWDADCLDTVIKTFERNDIIVTVRPFRRQSGDGGIFKEAVAKKPRFDKKKNLVNIPIKQDWAAEKYGGYIGETASYFTYIIAGEGEKRVKQFAPVPLRFANRNKARQYLLNTYIDCEILIECVPIGSQLIVRGHPVILRAYSGSALQVANFRQLRMEYSDSVIAQKLFLIRTRLLQDKRFVPSEDNVSICAADTERLFDVFRSLISEEGPYGNRPGIKTVRDAVNLRGHLFKELPFSDRVKMLIDMTKLFKRVPTSGSSVNMKPFEGVASAGGTQFPMTEPDIKLLITSPTGLYRKIIDLSEL